MNEPLNLPLLLRSAIGGLLMGLANLVPGISGGTMLLSSTRPPNFAFTGPTFAVTFASKAVSVDLQTR